MRNVAGPLPALAMLAAYFGLSLMDALIKGLTDSFHVGHIVALRYCFGALAAAPFLLLGARSLGSPEVVKASCLRAACVVLAAGTFFYALSVIPLAQATALAFTAPLFLVVFARLILGEPIPTIAILSIFVGFAGVMVMVYRDVSGASLDTASLLGAGCVLIAAVSYALVMVLTRLHSVSAEPAVMVFTQTVIAGLMTLPFLVLTFRPMGWSDVALFAVVGVLGSTAHLGIAWAFSRANAARLGPLEYSVLPWAVLFGYLLYSEVPRLETLVGGAMIVAACLLIFLRQLRPRV